LKKVAQNRDSWKKVAQNRDSWKKVAQNTDSWKKVAQNTDSWKKVAQNRDSWKKVAQNRDSWKKVAQNRDSWKKVVEQATTLYRLQCFIRRSIPTERCQCLGETCCLYLQTRSMVTLWNRRQQFPLDTVQSTHSYDASSHL